MPGPSMPVPPPPVPDGPIRIASLSRTPETRASVASLLRGLEGVEVCKPTAAHSHVTLYAVHSPQELIALLGPGFAPLPHSLVLDLESSLDPKAAALLGLPGYVRPNCPPEPLLAGLNDLRKGFPYAQEGFRGLFHSTRENGRLTPEEKQIMSLKARCYPREQIGEELGIEAGTLRHRITALRRRLGLSRGEILPVAAVRMGFPAEPAPPRGDGPSPA